MQQGELVLQEVQWLPYRTYISFSPSCRFIKFIMVWRQSCFQIVYKLQRGSADTSQITVRNCLLCTTEVPALPKEHRLFSISINICNIIDHARVPYIMIFKFRQYFYNSNFHTVF